MDETGESVSQQDFATLIMDALKSAGDQRNARYHDDSFRLLFDQDGESCGVLNLSNLHAEYNKLEADARTQRVSEIVRASLSHLKPIPEEFQDASYDLRPRLWARSTFETMKLRCRLNGDDVPGWPLESVGDNLYLSLVFDLPESVRTLNNQELENWGINYWEAREVAFQNLIEEDFVMTSLGDTLYASNTGDSYDATRLMLSGLVEQLDVEGTAVAMVPNRDTLLITGSESEVGLKMMVELAMSELKQNPRPLIATPLIYLDGQWEDWSFPADHPSHEEFRRSQLGWQQFEYGSQKKLLDSVFEREQIGDFVATFTVISKDQRHQSYCVWGEGVPSCLPKTDLVAFMAADQEGVQAFGTWEQVVQHCGELMDELEFYPPRYRVTHYPSAEQLEQLGGLDLA